MGQKGRRVNQNKEGKEQDSELYIDLVLLASG
jgi:hypothetical protein